MAETSTATAASSTSSTGRSGTSTAILAAGTALGALGRYQANMAQAQAEGQNASFYREQAVFAKETGNRQRALYERDAHVQFGEQESAFAKAGVDTSSNSFFLAKTLVSQQQESYAIKQEADMNVRLANLRAHAAEETKRQLEDPTNQYLETAATVATIAVMLI